MAKLSEFIKSLIVKAGGNVEDEKIKTALASIDATVELSPDISTAIDNGLISITNAKNNHPEIKNHYMALAYNGLDSELDRLMEEEKFGDDIVTEIKAEKSSTKRAALIAKKIKELEAAKQGQGKAETKVLNDKIVELNNELRKEKEGINTIKTDYEKKLRDKDKGYAMRNLLGTYKTIYDALDPDTKNITVNAIIEKNLRSKNYVLDVDENSNLTIVTKEGHQPFTEDNRPLTPKAFLDKVMADEKLLVATDTNNQNNNGRNNNQNNNNNSGGFNNRNNNNNSGGFNNRNNNQNNNQNDGNNNNSGKNTVLKELLGKSQADLDNAAKSKVM